MDDRARNGAAAQNVKPLLSAAMAKGKHGVFAFLLISIITTMISSSENGGKDAYSLLDSFVCKGSKANLSVRIDAVLAESREHCTLALDAFSGDREWCTYLRQIEEIKERESMIESADTVEIKLLSLQGRRATVLEIPLAPSQPSFIDDDGTVFSLRS